MSDQKNLIADFEKAIRNAYAQDWYFVDLTVENGFKILDILKKQEPRVLTLDEVKGLQSLKDGAVWLEMWRGTAFPALPEMLLSHISYFVAIPFNSYRGWVRNEYYGKTWRCWSSRPTKQQMEEVKWDDPNSY